MPPAPFPAVCPAAARAALCLFPQNEWLSADAPLSWAIWRNIPFALLGLLVFLNRKGGVNPISILTIAVSFTAPGFEPSATSIW